MDLSLKLLSIFALIVAAAYFAISEISLAGSRRVRLTQMAENGDKRAQEVINLQEKPGPFFSVIQIGINAVAILGGIVGEAAFTDVFAGLFKWFVPAQYLETTSFLCSDRGGRLLRHIGNLSSRFSPSQTDSNGRER